MVRHNVRNLLLPATGVVGAGVWGGVFKSTNGGGSWSRASAGLPARVLASGEEWITAIMALEVDPATPTTLYAGTGGEGLFKSSDGGGSWSPVSTGLHANAIVYVLAVDPTTPTTVYVGTLGGGVFKSTDGGETWLPSLA